MALELETKGAGQKLRPNEVSLFRRVFFARLEHGAPVEAAEKQALHACRIWERLGAFNEEPATGETDGAEIKRLQDALGALAAFVKDEGFDLNLRDDVIYEAIQKVLLGRLDVDGFKSALYAEPA